MGTLLGVWLDWTSLLFQCGLSCLSVLLGMGNVEHPRVEYQKPICVTFCAVACRVPCQESRRHLSATFRAAVCALAVERSRKWLTNIMKKAFFLYLQMSTARLVAPGGKTATQNRQLTLILSGGSASGLGAVPQTVHFGYQHDAKKRSNQHHFYMFQPTVESAFAIIA